VSVIQKDMSVINPTSREQLMLPSSIDDYVSEDHFVRFIDAFVDKVLNSNPQSVSLKGKSVEGRPCYSSNCLSKLLIYGYFNSVSSSRKLEKETKRNLEVIWLMQNQCPDHWTISDFRKENKELIKQITIGFRKFLKDCGYIKGKSVSGDGSKIKAYASRDALSLTQVHKKLENVEKEIERYLSQLNENDAIENEHEDMLTRKEELKNKIDVLQKQVEDLELRKATMEARGIEWISPTDPQARLMKSRNGYIPAYNVQNTVDNDTHFITTCEVTDYPNDYYSLEENANTLKEQLDIVPETYLADGGYANEEQIQSLEKQGIECIVPFAKESESKRIEQENGICFTYDETNDCFKCSQGKALTLIEKNHKKGQRLFNKYQCKQCGECPVKQHCTKSKKGRIMYRRIDGEWLKNYKEKLNTKEFREKFKQRKCVVEHPFGTMKYLMGQIPILLRGKEKVQVEMDLYSTAYNLIRLMNTESVPKLIEKLKKWEPLSVFLDYLSYHLKRKRLLYSIIYSKNQKI
jgi:transposase